MICKRHGEGWEIVCQRNHALLAAEMLADWSETQRPQPWFQLLNACSQHDHGWLETELDELVDESGQPVDFLHMTVEATIAIGHRSLRNAESQSLWCATLVARHLEYLSTFKKEPAILAFGREVRQSRRRWMAESGLTEAQVEKMYELLCWADTLSLLVCCQPSDFTRSLVLTAQGREFTACEPQPGVWTVHPWPYRGDRLQLEYEARLLPQSRFDDSQAFRQALSRTPVTLRALELRR